MTAVIVPAVVMFAIGLWGIDRGGMWRDEAVTFQVARRSAPEIWRLLHEVDAVHGLYYLLMHVVLAVPHPGEVVLRLPSACGAAVSAGLVGALGTRLGGRARVGLWAGLLYAITPLVVHYAQEGRSYALVTAGATGTTLLLLRAVEGRARRVWSGWGAYGGLLAVTCLLHEMAVLVVAAHAVTLAGLRVSRRVWGRWGCAAGFAVVVLLPLAWVSSTQSAQVGWLQVPGWRSALRVAREFLVVPMGVVFWVGVLVMLVGVTALRVSVVAVPLMVIPPALLMAASQVKPMYDDRYVLYALVGAPLLVAAGADRMAALVEGLVGRTAGRGRGRREVPQTGDHAGLRRAGRPAPGLPLSRAGASGSSGPGAGGPVALSDALVYGGTGQDAEAGPDGAAGRRPLLSPVLSLAGALVIGLVFLQYLPLYREDHTPASRPDNLATVSAIVHREVRPGDPVLFLPSIARRPALAYPKGFRGAWDIALGESGARSGTLYGREIGAEALRRRLATVDRVWVVAEPYALRGHWSPEDPADRVKLDVLRERFVPEKSRTYTVQGGVTVRLYVRRP
ncbi:glycosyltransferase family 39 protein [Streptomyces cellulosae]|uniref:Glycosyltransferase family 39 protein n=1 Tax=Streptomyces cellulosae TaxID=1968 RepID=A0ABW7YED4_STRCE